MMQTLLIACAACGIAMAQNLPLPPSGKPLPKLSNGKPDLSGMWMYQPAGNQESAPYKTEVLPKVRALAKDITADPGVSCFLLGTPRVTTWGTFPFKIIQT
ncbi:MAG: hypothetical protein M3N41_03405, partial [Acidobacteriota bacterium]|nr:hypothetical protein [Acidobacteriota bacterium]